MLHSLARAYHVAGHVISETSRTKMVDAALQQYQEMECIARIIDDHTLLNIALTYQGDMLRRKGATEKAITYLEAARDTTPKADTSARGNGIQLLARAYLQLKNTQGFESAMSETTGLTYANDATSDSTCGFYCLGTVYEEYAKSYALLGQAEKAMDYCELVEKTLPATAHWQTLLKTTRAIIHIHSGNITEGLPLAMEAADLCHKQGDCRILERVYSLQSYLNHMTRDMGKASAILRDMLDGPVEYT